MIRTDGTAAKNLRRIRSRFLRGARSIHLEEPNLSSEMFALLGIVHFAHLVCDVLKPVLDGLHSSNHSRELGADDSLLKKRFAKYLALVCPSIRSESIK